MLEFLKEWLMAVLRAAQAWVVMVEEIRSTLERDLDGLEARVVDLHADIWRFQKSVYGAN